MNPLSLSACTAMQLVSTGGAPYWFRTCDLDADVFANGAHPVSFPAGEVLELSCGKLSSGHSFMGITFNENPHWLLDGINDAGLSGGLLMFYEGTSLPQHAQGIVGMEFVTAMLAECTDTDDILKHAETFRILDIPHTGGHVPASMHYFFTDTRGKSIILEAADAQNRGKLTAYPSIGVLTNSPPYPAQIDNLRWFLAHSPELAGKILSLEDMVITPDAHSPHLSLSGTFPASYASYDRFIRTAVLKSLNNNGRDFSDEQMLVHGYNLMHALFEPHTQGLFHYSSFENGKPCNAKDSFSQYIIMYDILRRSLFIRPHDSLAWSSLCLAELPLQQGRFSICHDPESAIIPAHPIN